MVLHRNATRSGPGHPGSSRWSLALTERASRSEFSLRRDLDADGLVAGVDGQGLATLAEPGSPNPLSPFPAREGGNRVATPASMGHSVHPRPFTMAFDTSALPPGSPPG
jgi:hypothetical protein